MRSKWSHKEESFLVLSGLLPHWLEEKNGASKDARFIRQNCNPLTDGFLLKLEASGTQWLHRSCDFYSKWSAHRHGGGTRHDEMAFLWFLGKCAQDVSFAANMVIVGVFCFFCFLRLIIWIMKSSMKTLLEPSHHWPHIFKKTKQKKKLHKTFLH